MVGRFLFWNVNNQSRNVHCLDAKNVYGGGIVKKPGEFTKHIAEIIAKRWIKKTDINKNATSKNSQAKDKRDKQ